LGHEASNLTYVKKILLLRSLIMDAGWVVVEKDKGKDLRTIILYCYLECTQSVEGRNV
jgi:hypothetical protein